MTMCKTRLACRLTWALLGLALVAGVSGARAQASRDPTQPPAGASSATASDTSARVPAIDVVPVAVIVRDGRPYLVFGTRLYAQGQMLGDSRIERITETEVWLRDGKALRKRPVFTGIERRVAGAAAPAPACVVTNNKKRASTRVSPAPEICPP